MSSNKLATRKYDIFKSSVTGALILTLIVLMLLPLWQRSDPQAMVSTPSAEASITPTLAPLAAGETLAPGSQQPLRPTDPPPGFTPTPGLPEFPRARVEFRFNAATNELIAPDGSAVYALESESGQWLPIVPVEIANILPQGTTVSFFRDGWSIISPNGDHYFRWNPTELNWDQIQEVQPTPTPDLNATATPETATGVCPMPIFSRLELDSEARVLTTLNLRTSPEIANNISGVFSSGVVLEIIGGPVCTPYQTRAYLWWEVRSNDGSTGWSAEGSLSGTTYFLEPVR